MTLSQEKFFIGPKILAERPRQPSAVLLNGAPWEPIGNSVSSPEKLKPVYLPRTHGSPKRVDLQNAGGRIIAVSHSTAPVSSYKRVAFRALRIALYTTILATTEQVAIRLRLESEPTRTLRELVSRDCGLWLEPRPVDYILDYPPVNRAVLRT